jgi:hypothetical protein
MKTIPINKKHIYDEMIEKQIKNVEATKHLGHKEFVRIVDYIDKSIFGDECSVWTGYICYENTDIKRTNYVNFFVKTRKYALHRLLYSNFIAPLTDADIIKFTCNNKGKCCTLKHLKLCSEPVVTKEIKPNSKRQQKKIESRVNDLSNFVISFD